MKIFVFFIQKDFQIDFEQVYAQKYFDFVWNEIIMATQILYFCSSLERNFYYTLFTPSDKPQGMALRSV